MHASGSDSAVVKEWRHYSNRDEEPLNPLNDPVYFHFLVLGPLTLLKMLLETGAHTAHIAVLAVFVLLCFLC